MRNSTNSDAQDYTLRVRVIVGLFLAALVTLMVASYNPVPSDSGYVPAAHAWLHRPDGTPITTPAPTGNDLVMAASSPSHISIPAISVESALMDLGLTAEGELEVPPTAFPAGWFTGAPTPGQRGPAIIAGHVDYDREEGVFHSLHELEPGDEVFVLREDGDTAVFEVQSVEQYAKNEFPTDVVYGNIDHAGLRLITCGGEFDWEVISHRDNVVVFAQLIRIDGALASASVE